MLLKCIVFTVPCTRLHSTIVVKKVLVQKFPLDTFVVPTILQTIRYLCWNQSESVQIYIRMDACKVLCWFVIEW